MFTFERSIPEEAGISSIAIKNLLSFLDKKDIPMHSLLIMKEDKLVFEKYYAPYTASTLHRMFSISKSFTGLAISLLADEGRIDLDKSVTEYFPEYTNEKTHKWIKGTTIRNMLMMRTCHASTTYKVDMKSDWVESFFTVAPTHKPGTVFHYDTSAVHVLCALVEKETGLPMLDYLKEKVLKYLDFSEDSYMVKDPFGVSIGGSGLMATPMDILKVLYLLDKKGTITCNDGVVRTLINPEFIELATSDLSPSIMTGPIPSESAGYGMQIWQNEMGGYVMYGMGGQLAISIPDYKLLIMTTADTQGINGGNQVIYDGIYNILLSQIQSDSAASLADDSKANPNVEKENLVNAKPDYDELIKYADTLRISLPRCIGKEKSSQEIPEFIGSLNRRVPDKSDSTDNSDNNDNAKDEPITLRYSLEENKQGFLGLALTLSNKGPCTISFTQNEQSTNAPSDNSFFTNYFKDSYQYTSLPIGISFGLNEMVTGDIKKYDAHYTAGATWIRDNDLYIRVHLIGECVGSIRFELFFGDKDITVFTRKIEETYFREFDGHLYGTLLPNSKP